MSYTTIPTTREDPITDDTATRANFTKKLEEQVEAMRKRFQTMELDQMKKGEIEARQKLETAKEAVERKQKQIRSQLDRARKASDAAWDDTREGLENAWNELEGAVERARKDFAGELEEEEAEGEDE